MSEELPGREEEGEPRGVPEADKKVFQGAGSEQLCRMLQKGQLR